MKHSRAEFKDRIYEFLLMEKIENELIRLDGQKTPTEYFERLHYEGYKQRLIDELVRFRNSLSPIVDVRA